MKRQATATGPVISKSMFNGLATDEHCVDRNVLECIEAGDVTITFNDDSVKTITALAGARYILNPDVKSLTSSMNINLL